MNTRFSIPNPCHKKWSDLQGSGRERFCEECRKPVYAVDQYSAEEWARLRHESGGHICGLSVGQVPSPQITRRAILSGALLTAISPLMAEDGRIRVRAIDASGAAVVGARGSLLTTDGKSIQTSAGDQSGELVFSGVAPGDWRLEVSCPGFKTSKFLANLWEGKELKIDAHLEIGAVGTIIDVKPTTNGKPGKQAERTGMIWVHVRKSDGDILTGGNVSVLSATGEPARTVQAIGHQIFLSLPMGNSRIRVNAPNLRSYEFDLTLPKDEGIQIEAFLPPI